MQLSREVVCDILHEVGFDLCGVVEACYLPIAETRFRRWLDRGDGEPLGYLYNNLDKRFDPSILMEGGRSVVVCGVNYNQQSQCNGSEQGVGVAMYATMRDYHKTIKKMLNAALEQIQLRYISGNIKGRVFTDSAPLVEKSLAVEAGFGWIGRHSLLVTPQYGTYVLLGEILLDAEFDSYDSSSHNDRCGSCRRCIDSCPVGAINDDRTIDTRRCIACRTIEMDDSGDASLAGWIFGCDVCQVACPYNHSKPQYTNEYMRPIFNRPSADEWLAMTPAEFDRQSAGTPIRRSSLARIQNNIRKNKLL